MRRHPAEWGLAAVAAVLMAGVRLGLAVRSVGTVRRWLDRVVVGGTSGLAPSAPDDVALAVARAAPVVPGATCLVQSLVLEALLRRRGHPARLCLGFARPSGLDIAGHAWVESAGWASPGAAEAAGYVRARAPRPEHR